MLNNFSEIKLCVFHSTSLWNFAIFFVTEVFKQLKGFLILLFFPVRLATGGLF